MTALTEPRRFAAIDIGTVTCRLLVAEASRSGLVEIARACAITNLGEGVAESGILLEEAMGRVDEQMARFMGIVADIEERDGLPIEVIAMATSASRDARNAAEFVELLSRRGIELSVITGEREASLSFKGASSAFPGEPLLVVDIGGGSTEVIAGIGGREPLFKRSFDIGCRRVTEASMPSDPFVESELEAARAQACDMMAPFFDKVAEEGFVPARLVAVAGTATTVVSVRDATDPYDSSRVHLSEVSRAELDEITARLASLPLVERAQVVGLQEGRAPVIVAGMAILQSVMDLARVERFTVSESDILQGIIADAADVDDPKSD